MNSVRAEFPFTTQDIKNLMNPALLLLIKRKVAVRLLKVNLINIVSWIFPTLVEWLGEIEPYFIVPPIFFIKGVKIRIFFT